MAMTYLRSSEENHEPMRYRVRWVDLNDPDSWAEIDLGEFE